MESLTSARAGVMSGNEPSDALRVCLSGPELAKITVSHPSYQVVNALLTQIDRLKHQKNVLIMATSNLAKAIGM